MARYARMDNNALHRDGKRVSALLALNALQSTTDKDMTTDLDWKRFQFITEVQTALIANAINVSLEDDAKVRRHIFSATGTLINMDDAFYAADRIPKNLSAHEAAAEFIGFVCENLRDEDAKVPLWFARF